LGLTDRKINAYGKITLCEYTVCTVRLAVNTVIKPKVMCWYRNVARTASGEIDTFAPKISKDQQQ
jgi:hypothetical protein